MRRSVKGLPAASQPSPRTAAAATAGGGAGKTHLVVPKPHPSTAHTILAAKAALSKAKGQSIGDEDDEGTMRASMESKPWNPYGKKEPAQPKPKLEVSRL